MNKIFRTHSYEVVKAALAVSRVTRGSPKNETTVALRGTQQLKDPHWALMWVTAGAGKASPVPVDLCQLQETTLPISMYIFDPEVISIKSKILLSSL